MNPPRIGVDASRLAVLQRTGTEQYTAHLLPALIDASAGRERWRLYFNRPPSPWPAWLIDRAGAGSVNGPPVMAARATDGPVASEAGGAPGALSVVEAGRAGGQPGLVAGSIVERRVIPWPRLWTHLRLATELRRDPPDLLFVPAHVVPVACPVPAVVTIHDLGYRRFPKSHPAATRLYLEVSTWWSSHRARRIIAISETTKQELMRAYRLPSERIDVIYHGIAPHFRPPTDHERSRGRLAALGIRQPYLLAVGTVQPRKNYPRLIGALARLRAEGFDQRLVIVGRVGWLSSESLAAPAAAGIASQVLFTGYLPDEVMPDLYAHATAVVLPSLYEGLGMPAAEAMACGAPLVCAASTALPEVAGSAAEYCQPDSIESITAALRRLLSQPERRFQLVSAGFQQAARFTWEGAAQATRATLQRALSE